MRSGALVVVASLSSACLFPSLDFAGGQIDAAVESGTDASFTAGIGCASVTADLLAYYVVDEGSGTIVHDCVSSPANDGTVLNATHTSWVAGKHGKALEIDPGAGVCVAIDLTPTFAFGGSVTAFTVAMWIQIVALPPSGELGYIVGQSSNISTAGWRFSVAPGGVIQLAVPNGSGGIANVVGSMITVGAWHHVAAVYAGASSAVYLDGKATQQALPASFVADLASDHVRVGCSSDDQHQLHAQVDEIRFYNRALSAAEIAIVENAN